MSTPDCGKTAAGSSDVIATADKPNSASHNVSFIGTTRKAGRKMVARRKLGQPVSSFLLEPLRDIDRGTQTLSASPPSSHKKGLRSRYTAPGTRTWASERLVVAEGGESSTEEVNDNDDDISEFQDSGASDSEGSCFSNKPNSPCSPARRSRPRRGEPVRQVSRPPSTSEASLAGQLSSLQLESPTQSGIELAGVSVILRQMTPPRMASSPAGKEELVSPAKLFPRIPGTPHHPDVDIFWSQDFVDDWNTEHSPGKPLLRTNTKDPGTSGVSPKKTTVAQREAKKTFVSNRHQTADAFVAELDHVITGGRLGELAASTGGVRVTWSNRLNTTAGRAHWRRETNRTEKGGSLQGMERHRHHASIELAEKVIDNEDRLLNVVAHEFCHLACFMVSGVTTNPHGREFKAWAAKCSRAFGHRGIKVTTKHSYDIDFKYVWQCAECKAEFKRHSKSIDVRRQRCGTCKGELEQIKPRPRAAAVNSEYQRFVQKEMSTVRQANPGSPQKEVMRLVAEKWKRGVEDAAKPMVQSASEVDDVSGHLAQLMLDSDR